MAPNIKAVQAAAAKRSTKKKEKGQYGYYLAIGGCAVATIMAAILGASSGPAGPKRGGARDSALEGYVNDKGIIADVLRGPNFTAAASPFFDKWTVGDIKYGFDGVKISGMVGMAGAVKQCEQDDTFEGGHMPINFDAREKWPNCITGPVYDSGNCSSSYAIAAAQSLSARFCIADEDKYAKTRLSPQQVLSCDKKSRGCQGGGIDSVWSYMQRRGLYPEECLAYVGKKGTECKTTCDEKKKLKPISHCVMSGVKEIKREILENGPVVAPIRFHQDLLVYSGGVYSAIDSVPVASGQDGKPVLSAVAVIGWGKSAGIPYWIIENSWGTEWGEKGFAKVAIGAEGPVLEHYFVVGYPETAEALEKAAKAEKEADIRRAQRKQERAERDERIAAQKKAQADAQQDEDLDNFDDVDDLDDIDLDDAGSDGGDKAADAEDAEM